MPRSATPPVLRLTKDDENELRALCDELEIEVLSAYEEYLYTNNRCVDPQRWKSVRSKDDMFVYRERKAFKHSASSTSSNSNSSGAGLSELFSTIHQRSNSGSGSGSHSNSTGRGASSLSSSRSEMATTLEIGPMHAMAASSTMPIVMVAGTAPGTLTDALYGVSLTDTESVRRRNVYQKEKLENCAVVATLDTPTFEDPFLFRGVVWFLKDYPVINAIVKPRDLLLLTNIRQTRTSRGDAIGVALYHSITHRDLLERRDGSVIRVQNSLSAVFRQLDDQRVEIFMTNFVDPMGNVPEMFVTQDLAQALLTSVDLPRCGLKRKLHFLMRSRPRHPSMAAGGTLTATTTAAANTSAKPSCVSCEKVLGRTFSGNGSVCQLCYQLACSKCRVSKKIVVDATSTSVTVKPFDFCLGCIMAANATSASRVARSELGLVRGHSRATQANTTRRTSGLQNTTLVEHKSATAPTAQAEPVLGGLI